MLMKIFIYLYKIKIQPLNMNELNFFFRIMDKHNLQNLLLLLLKFNILFNFRIYPVH